MIPAEHLEAIRTRDEETVLDPMFTADDIIGQQPVIDRRTLLAELDRLHSWDGLMELLDEHWPDDIFVTAPDPEVYGELWYRREGETYVRANPGARIIGLMRWLDKLREQLAAVHSYVPEIRETP